MTDAELLAAVNATQIEKKQRLNAWVMFAVSLVIFAGLGAFRWSAEFVVLLAVALLVHESGHLLAMRIYRYRNLKMMFLPLIGGVAMGETRRQDAYKTAMIAVFGPLAGLLSVVAAVMLWMHYRQDYLVRYASLALYLNLFNLLPLVPLDGGHVLNEALFSRFPRVELIFRIGAVIGLGWLAHKLGSWVPGLLAFFILFTLHLNYKLARVAKELGRAEGMRGGELTEEKVAEIRRVLLARTPAMGSERNAKALPRVVATTWEKINKAFPTIPGMIFVLVAYLVVTVGLGAFGLGSVVSVRKTFKTREHRVAAQNALQPKAVVMESDDRTLLDSSLNGNAPPGFYDADPQVLVRSQPIYPPRMLAAGREGWAEVHFTVDQTGRVGTVTVAGATDPEFGAAARAAIAKWRFTPVSQAGYLTTVTLKKTFYFKIQTPAASH